MGPTLMKARRRSSWGPKGSLSAVRQVLPIYWDWGTLNSKEKCLNLVWKSKHGLFQSPNTISPRSSGGANPDWSI
jgi:hypothetical protein